MGSSLKTVALAAAAMAVLAPQISKAADLPLPAPLPAPVIAEFGGWYLRGDVGMSNQDLKGLNHPLFATATGFEFIDKGGFDSAPFVGIGFGYRHNSWFRWDATAEYRGGASFYAMDRYVIAAGPPVDYATNDYRAKKTEWLFMLNGYLDLGTWRGFTPFVGAGIGMSRNTISHFTDTNVIAAGGGYASSGSKWDMAWALHAGLAYEVTPNFAIELAYRYLDLGDGKTGTLLNQGTGTCTTCAPMEFNGITSHDFKLGVRWMFADAVAYQPPLITKY